MELNYSVDATVILGVLLFGIVVMLVWYRRPLFAEDLSDALPGWVKSNLDGKGYWVVHNPVSYDTMFRQVAEQRWEDPVASWQNWKRKNPQYRGG